MKFISKNIITILSLLVTIIVSVTAYAYKTDQNAERNDRIVQDSVLNMMLKMEITERKSIDLELELSIDKKIEQHEKNETIKYQAFKEDLTDLKSMVKFIYEIEYKKANPTN
jgi:Na+-transporting NADH:ubiquinone oxidoreductase subunit NqrC